MSSIRLSPTNISNEELDQIFNEAFEMIGIEPEDLRVSCDALGVPAHWLSDFDINY